MGYLKVTPSVVDTTILRPTINGPTLPISIVIATIIRPARYRSYYAPVETTTLPNAEKDSKAKSLNKK